MIDLLRLGLENRSSQVIAASRKIYSLVNSTCRTAKCGSPLWVAIGAVSWTRTRLGRWRRFGAFRVVPAAELLDGNADLRDGDLRHLIDEGLVTREAVADTAGSQRLLALTDAARNLLDGNRHPDFKEAP